MLVAPTTHAEVSDLTRPENRYETGGGKLLEVYRPVWTPSGQPLLFETYMPYDSVTDAHRRAVAWVRRASPWPACCCSSLSCCRSCGGCWTG